MPEDLLERRKKNDTCYRHITIMQTLKCIPTYILPVLIVLVLQPASP